MTREMVWHSKIGLTLSQIHRPLWAMIAPDTGRLTRGGDRDGMQMALAHLTKARGHTVSKVISNLPGDHRFPEISPGGTKLAFASETAPDRSDIFVMDLVGLVITPSTSTLLSEEFTGSVPMQLTDESRYDTSPSWSPDATRLAYLSKPSGGDPRHPLWHVWVVNADGTGAVDLSPNPPPSGQGMTMQQRNGR